MGTGRFDMKLYNDLKSVNVDKIDDIVKEFGQKNDDNEITFSLVSPVLPKTILVHILSLFHCLSL